MGSAVRIRWRKSWALLDLPLCLVGISQSEQKLTSGPTRVVSTFQTSLLPSSEPRSRDGVLETVAEEHGWSSDS